MIKRMLPSGRPGSRIDLHPAVLAAAFGLFPAAACAHPGHDGVGFIAGLLHPFSGPDHMIAILAIGLWAAQLERRARLLVPLTFIVAMMIGALYGDSNPTSSIAAVIPVTTAIVIAAVALRWRPAMSLAVLAVALFGVAHGWAHGLEAVRSAYLCGVLSATAVLQLAGVWLGASIQRARSPAGT